MPKVPVGGPERVRGCKEAAGGGKAAGRRREAAGRRTYQRGHRRFFALLVLLPDRLPGGEHHRANRRRERRLHGGDHRGFGVRRKTLGDNRNLGATAGHRHRREISAANPVAAQHVIECSEQIVETVLDQAVQLLAAQLEASALPRQIDGQSRSLSRWTAALWPDGTLHAGWRIGRRRRCWRDRSRYRDPRCPTRAPSAPGRRGRRKTPDSAACRRSG